MQRIALLAVGLAGCLAPPGRNDDGGQSGVANPPEFCVEDERAVVVDPTVPADGFAFAAADVTGRVTGRWEGAADLDGTGEIAVTLDVATVGDIVAVRSHLEGGSDDTQSEALGAPVASCPPVYEIGLSLALAAPPALTADLPALWVVGSFDGPDQFAGSVPAQDAEGTLRPPDWPEPEMWERELLSASFAGDTVGATLGLEWAAINDDAEGDASGSGTGATSTATVEPSAMNEWIASVPLTRAP